jgi:hypothetical protein
MTAPRPARRRHRPAERSPVEAAGNGMRARVSDEIVVRGTAGGVIAREGEVVGVHHPDGSPPYDVRWDTGRVTLYFPGPDAYVKHLHAGTASPGRGS